VSKHLLAIDTSHMRGSVAVTRMEVPLCELLFDASDTHSATMMPAVDTCLEKARTRLADIDIFVTVIGPGSFTGLRIGLATVKGLAAVGGRPVVPIGSLEALAAALPFADRPVLPLIDARRGEVYAALFDTSSGYPAEIVSPFSSSPEGLTESIGDETGNKPVIVCGTGAERCRDELGKLPQGASFCGPRWLTPSASIAAFLALDRDPVPFEALSSLEPLYIRPPDARPPSSARLRPGAAR
jgi:tRNA threonylcarbamoyladenosine biosynthesis protein TsaB